MRHSLWHSYEPGNLVRYMSRIVLIIEVGDVWCHGMELGEDYVSKYKVTALGEVVSK